MTESSSLPWQAVLIAGPTASGKSALARAIAQRLGGTIINADSMQVYRELRILTARPTPEEESVCPHRLFGHIGVDESYSVGRWLGDAEGALAQARAQGRLPIFVGGTGLYFAALTEGLAAVPPVPEAVRAAVRARLTAQGAAGLHEELARRDPAMAARLRPNDSQRIARALEVLEATGQSLAVFQRARHAPLVTEADTLRLVLAPPRAKLYARIDARFTAMVAAGALDEVAALGRLPERAPARRALGVAPLVAVLEGRLGLEEAVAQAQQESRRYAKRQLTWAKTRMISWVWLETKYLESLEDNIFSNIIHPG